MMGSSALQIKTHNEIDTQSNFSLFLILLNVLSNAWVSFEAIQQLKFYIDGIWETKGSSKMVENVMKFHSFAGLLFIATCSCMTSRRYELHK